MYLRELAATAASCPRWWHAATLLKDLSSAGGDEDRAVTLYRGLSCVSRLLHLEKLAAGVLQDSEVVLNVVHTVSYTRRHQWSMQHATDTLHSVNHCAVQLLSDGTVNPGVEATKQCYDSSRSPTPSDIGDA